MQPERQLATIQANPFKVDRIVHEWHAGDTLEDVLLTAQPQRSMWNNCHIYLNGIEIKREYWHVTRPHLDVQISITSWPADGGDILRTVAFIALAVAAPYAGGIIGSSGLATTAAGASALSIGVSTAVFVAGSLLINALIPIDTPSLDDGDSRSQALSVAAARNRLNPFGNLPTWLGYYRYAPPFGAAPYTELNGDDQFVVMLFTLGFMPIEVDIDTIRIGNTLLSTYDDVEAEYLTGGSGDNVTEITLYKNLAFEDVVAKQIPDPKAGGYAQHTSAAAADELSFEIHFPRGLVVYQSDGGTLTIAVNVTVEYAPSPQGPWSPMEGDDFDSNGVVKFLGQSPTPIRKGYYWVPPAPGQWTLRMSVDKPSHDGPTIYNTSTFAILRSFKYGSPIADPTISQIALRIKATDQLSGVPDQVTVYAQSMIPDWSTGAWVDDSLTNNPASLARYILTGKPNRRALDVSRLDDASFTAFWTYCNTNSLTYNQVIDFNVTINDTLNSICRAAFSRPVQIDGIWKIITDVPQTVPRQVFTPRNSWGFSGTKTYPEQIEGFRIRFIDESEQNYNNSEQIVYADNYDDQNNTGNFEQLEAIGITNWDQIWKYGRRYLAIAKLQPEQFTLSTDPEHLVSIVGDLVELHQDAILVGLGASRVKFIDDTTVILDAKMPGDGGSSYSIQFRHKDGLFDTVPVLTFGGETDTLTFVTPGTYGDIGDLATFGISTRINQQMLIKNIEPGPDLSARLTLIPYAAGIYTAASGTIPDYNPVTTVPPGTETPVISQMESDEYVMWRDSAGVLQPRILGTFAFIGERTQVQGVIVQWRRYSTSQGSSVGWISLAILPGDTGLFTITEVDEGMQVEIRTRFLFRDGTSGIWSYFYDSVTDTPYHTVIGKTRPPPDVDGAFTVQWQASGLREYHWNYDPLTLLPPDLDGFQIRYFDSDNLTGDAVQYGLLDGNIYGALVNEPDPDPLTDYYGLLFTADVPDWEEMTPLTLGRLYHTPFEYNAPFAGGWYFAIKALDVGGLESVNALYTPLMTLPNPQLGNSLFYLDHWTNNWLVGQNPGGIFDLCSRSPATGYLIGDSTQTWATGGTWAGMGTWQGAPVTTYTFSHEAGVITFDSPGYTGDIRMNFTTDTLASGGTFVFRYAVDGGSFTGNEILDGDIITGLTGATSLEFQMEATGAPAEGVRNWIVEGFANA